ncbi:MAG: threonylcarbamoyl-AMP synthase [Verrucomicrobia bacterium]|nr:MAG: threonylcarbamoyl-AMP synthase [Verrucomicrobiota bacterium]
MKTEVVSAQECAKAIKLLRDGEVVALPTETVYGLAADALNPDAVAKIFEAKERPRFDPLIVHLPNREALDEIATVESRLARELMEKFWPGPLTIIFSKREIVPDIVTAGLETVAVRMSAHLTFHEVVRKLNRPLAAPSANQFGRISPTTAQHVFDELNGRIPLIVDGGATEHGIESTIVQVANRVIAVWRRGPITDEMLRPFGEVREQTSPVTVGAPGQLPTHYAPRTKLIVVESLREFSPPSGKGIGVLCFSSVGDATPFAVVRQLSERGDPRQAAANFFRMLRELDREDLDLIVAERLPEEGIGAAINDRLARASARFDPSSRA